MQLLRTHSDTSKGYFKTYKAYNVDRLVCNITPTLLYCLSLRLYCLSRTRSCATISSKFVQPGPDLAIGNN